MPHADNSLSIITPIYNEGGNTKHLFTQLEIFTQDCEVLLIDASDEAQSIKTLDDLYNTQQNSPTRRHQLRLIRSSILGRAEQMNLGVKSSISPWLLFLHADTRLPYNAAKLIAQQFERGKYWGRFNIQLNAKGLAYRIIEYMINLRSSLSGIATGDQAIFVSRSVFNQVGGFPSIPLMEDIALSKVLKKISRPGLIRTPVTTSARRWQQQGIIRTVWLMWKLRFLYWIGIKPSALARMYDCVR